MDPRRWLAFLEELADAADPIALRYFRAQDLHVEEKPELGPVTQADLAIEEEVRKRVAERHPGIGVFGEEQGETGAAAACRLIIDPIDATRNFVRGIPVFATLLAIEDAGEIVAGVVSAPALGARWRAARGEGAFHGARSIRVSGISRLDAAQLFHGSVVGVERPDSRTGSGSLDLLGLMQRTARQRGFGDFYQHVLVAEGCGEIAVDPVVAPWDIAALQVIVEEAGGRGTSLEGEATIYSGSFVTSNGLLHDPVLRILRGAGAG